MQQNPYRLLAFASRRHDYRYPIAYVTDGECSGANDGSCRCFTAVSCVSVTGLATVDTYYHWSLFGKLVMVILIQLGG